MTSAWIVYRMEDMKVRILGIYKSRQDAEDDVRVTDDDDWEVAEAPFIGWGIPNG
jgi:hypothetical protein